MAGRNFAHSEMVLLNTIQGLFVQANLLLCESCGCKSFPGYTTCLDPDCEARLPSGMPSRKRALALSIFNFVLAHLRNHLPPPQGSRRILRAIRYVVQIENARQEGAQTLAKLMDPDDLIAMFDLNNLMAV
ncbi:uncharacterized protein FFB20_08293 [Fusarium fujikuroi]|uniref:Uncharacterized protein n=1 Tax=Fusarium fujikuroi TaxID=5127 RepID=A0A2H3RC56_FUSFU|nr:uncharacterized protein Y057_7104 [Fusarium fujikuroi]KLP16922.1 uncharacterized protein LW94_15136 [Fusarium fujikuroi]QGI57990.1 hypothetical protein CEK27_000115 [Fusarium fujikuroi]QGI75208.1 hypothetical protein CEK25_000114 [Fusarium fujikuroi]QGI88901.1 hypothetical protein CEK26_000116 [Fusarium fujikuroi]